MTTQTEALKLAIEALKSVLTDPDGNVCWQGSYADRDIIGDALYEFEKFLAQQSNEQVEPVANGKLTVTLQDTPTEIELAQYKRMLQAACADLGAINEALGLDPNDGGAEPILLAIEELRRRSQEPMAWMVYTLDGTSVCVTDNPSSFTPEHRALPLYTTPPTQCNCSQRQCNVKPLTDDEIWDEVKAADLDWQTGWSLDEDASNRYITFARAIEAAHGIMSDTDGKE